MNKEKSNLQVLLVDDDRVFSGIVSKQFQFIEAKLECCDSYKEAVSIVQSRHFDFVICDYDLIDGTGFEVAEYFLQKSCETPVVLVSSTNRPMQDKLRRLPNVIGFVSKWQNQTTFLHETFMLLLQKTGLNMSRFMRG